MVRRLASIEPLEGMIFPRQMLSCFVILLLLSEPRRDIHDTVSLTLTDGEQANLTRDAEQANPEVETSLAGRGRQQAVLWTRVAGWNL